MSDNLFPVRTPDPLAMAQWAGLGRHFLTALAGAGVIGATWAAVSVEDIANVLTIVLAAASLAGGAWGAFRSWRQKIADEKASKVLQHAAAVASAEQTAKATQDANRPVLVPVTVTVTPAGQDNEAVRVSAAEARASPSVPAGMAPSPAPRAV